MSEKFDFEDQQWSSTRNEQFQDKSPPQIWKIIPSPLRVFWNIVTDFWMTLVKFLKTPYDKKKLGIMKETMKEINW